MTTRLRLALFACAGFMATVFTGNALAAINPEMLVAQQDTTNTTIRVRVPIADDPAAVVRLFVPQGWTANLTQPAGTTIGQVVAEANARAISPDARLPLTGTIVAVTPTANPCTGAAPRAQWELRLTAAGQSLTIPAYIDALAAPAPEAQFASHRIQFCLPPQSTAQFQAKLLEARLAIQGVFTQPALPEQLWRGVFTPYTGTTAALQPAATKEAQSLIRQPKRIQLRVRQVGRLFRLAGSVFEGNRPAAGATVQIFRGGRSTRVGRYLMRRVATKQTAADGTFTHQIRFRTRGWARFEVRATAPAPNPAATEAMNEARSVACVNPLPATTAPAGCTNAKLLGFNLSSGVTRPYRIR